MQLYYRQFSDLIVQALGKEKGLQAMLINYNVLQQLMESRAVVWISVQGTAICVQPSRDVCVRRSGNMSSAVEMVGKETKQCLYKSLDWFYANSPLT